MKEILFLVLIVVSLVNANILYDLSKDDINSVKNSHNFTGKVVLITGSDSGIGEGITKLFSALGAQVVVTGRNVTKVTKVGAEVQQLSPKKLKPLEVVADITKTADLERLINQTIITYGKLDVLVNNAGTGASVSISDKTFMQTYDFIMNINLRSAAQLNHLAVPYLQKTNGSIVHISSIAGIAPMNKMAAYSMSKAAMDMMTKCLALELGPLGIRVNSINPGVIATDSVANLPVVIAIREKAVKRTPLRRSGQVLDVAKGVAFLSSTDASFITGANLVIDGGLVYNSGDML